MKHEEFAFLSKATKILRKGWNKQLIFNIDFDISINETEFFNQLYKDTSPSSSGRILKPGYETVCRHISRLLGREEKIDPKDVSPYWIYTLLVEAEVFVAMVISI